MLCRLGLREHSVDSNADIYAKKFSWSHFSSACSYEKLEVRERRKKKIVKYKKNYLKQTVVNTTDGVHDNQRIMYT